MRATTFPSATASPATATVRHSSGSTEYAVTQKDKKVEFYFDRHGFRPLGLPCGTAKPLLLLSDFAVVWGCGCGPGRALRILRLIRTGVFSPVAGFYFRRVSRLFASSKCPACLGEQFFDRLGRQHALAQFFELRSRACVEPFLSPMWHGAEPLLDQAP